ncbi:UPF0029-domain-containing protein [Sanghuangporus baumii]|uniref:UPF0029-domain-containing protein n=1 Tax=Sanghuangporus baumii TaxID=108892 RepID=A0A9Q5N8C6_SANBA|nr:UPF0029-domain-containing protein [Sanghuangporus baumii]
MNSNDSSQSDKLREDDAQELDNLTQELSLDPAYEQIISEIGVLQSIYGEDSHDSIKAWKPNGSNGNGGIGSDEKAVRYEVHLGLPPPHDSPEARFRVLVSLPRSYPSSSPPQFQLLSRYIGPFGVDADLFGAVLRTFISSRGGVEFLPGSECVFDGLENVRERVAAWYSERLSEEKTQELVREDEKERIQEIKRGKERDVSTDTIVGSSSKEQEHPDALPDGLTLAISEPIVDRKSVFIGRACRITNPVQVPTILSHLMADRRISRAAHPIINAWRCRTNGVLHQDNDDDGETAAGGRLAHLLQILDVDNVLVIVTRYFGGIHLGPDRFKHINQAARNALELGGFLDTPDERKNTSRLKKKG